MIGSKSLVRTAAAVALALLCTACGIQVSDKPADKAQQGGPPPLPAPLTLVSRPGATGGEALFIEKCGMCHGPGGMGTGLLARRVDQPLLEERKDLTVDYVIQAVRTGIGNMPAIPRGEASDEQLRQIAEYLAGLGKAK